MNRQELIEDIINEVCKKFVNELSAHRGSASLMVIGTLTKEEEEALKDYPHMPFTPGQSNYEKVLISTLTVTQMAHLALGYGDTPEEVALLEAQLQGKQVYVLERGLEYRKYKDTAPKNLYALYHDYERTLRQYGVLIIKSIRECDTLPSERVQSLSEPNLVQIHESGKEKTHVFHKKLLLEKDLISARVGFNETLELASHCKITPLAEDFIRAHHLTILKI
ncbi:MAG: hypothetical protein RR448_09685 [Niameybacter sp.]|uniref:hypothetical protein n=1 Tax=Niameybacter sp. TaxID=2033640 RepID=UPI002FCADFAA